MKFKCKKCGSTEVECEYESGKDFIISGAGANVGMSNVYDGGGRNFTEFITAETLSPDDPYFLKYPNPGPIQNVSCDHLYSGNACCPCGRSLNQNVKGVCVRVDGKQTWPVPYGKKGLSLENALRTLAVSGIPINDRSEASLLKTMWDMQMISGEVYITRLREIGDKKQESCERMK